VERLEERRLLSITPGPGLTLSPTPVEGIQSTNITVATFSTADAAGTLSSTIFWGDGTSSAGTVTAVGTVSGLTQYDVLGTHTYAEETTGKSTNAVVVQVNDTTDATVAFINSITAVGDAPLSPFATSTISNVEGVAINPTTATFTDANTGATAGDYTAVVNWGDGSSPTVGTVSATATPGRFTVSAGHTYKVNGSYPVTTTITDDGGQSLTFVNTATITDAALTLGPTLALTTPEGQRLSNEIVGTFTDADAFGTASDFSATIDWGDATPTTSGIITKIGNSGGGAVFAIMGSHTYTTVGTPTISVAVTDVGGSTIGSSTSAAVSVTQQPLLLTVFPQVATAATATPTNQVVATFVDPGGADIGYTATVDFGDGSGPVAATVVPNGGNSFSVEAPAHTYTASGQYPLTVSVTDPDPITVSGSAVAFVGGSTTLPSLITVSALPVVATEGAATAAGTPVATFVAQNGPATPGSYTATIDWGDGTSTSTGTVTALGGGVFQVTAPAHTYAEEGSDIITVTVTQGSLTGLSSSQAHVADAPLTAGPVVAFNGPEGMLLTNRTLGSFTDANPSALPTDFTATVDWGDGTTPSRATVVATSGGFSVVGEHEYADARVNGGHNIFPVTVTVVDTGGARVQLTSAGAITDNPITLTGVLAPGSYYSASSAGFFTNVSRPQFYGQSEPYSTVELIALSYNTHASTVIGQTQANGSGAWTIATNPLADGRYAITAVALDRAHFTTAVTVLMGGSSAQGPLVVDTVAPTVVASSFGATTGQILVTFQDTGAGLNPASMLNPHYYHLLAGGRPFGTLRVTNMTTPALAQAGKMSVLVTINNGGNLPAGNYVFAIDSGGVNDLAGNPLNGAFSGTLPSGNSLPAIGFAALLNPPSRTFLPVQAVASAAASPARATTAVAKPAALTASGANAATPLAVFDAALFTASARKNPWKRR
jgi:hypothetical protein